MTLRIILLCILAIILFILFMPAAFDFRYEKEKVLVRISYCGFTIFDTSKEKKEKTPEEIEKEEKKKAIKKQKKEQKKAAKAAKKAKKGKAVKNKKEEKEKRSLKEMFQLIHSLLAPVKKGLRRLFKGIRISKLYIDIKVGKFDAYECAMEYGKICAAVSNLLAFFQSFFIIKSDRIEILPRFSMEKTLYTIKFRAKISPAAVLAAGFSLAWTYLLEMMHKQQAENINQNNKPNDQRSKNIKEEHINANSK